MRQTTIDGKDYLTQITNMYYNNNKSIGTDKTLKIPMTKNGEEFSINSLASDQKKVFLAVIDTIIKFLQNEESYVPFRATVVGYGQTIDNRKKNDKNEIPPFWLELHQEQQLTMFRGQLCIIYLA
jgi:hypothetical protein